MEGHALTKLKSVNTLTECRDHAGSIKAENMGPRPVGIAATSDTNIHRVQAGCMDSNEYLTGTRGWIGNLAKSQGIGATGLIKQESFHSTSFTSTDDHFEPYPRANFPILLRVPKLSAGEILGLLVLLWEGVTNKHGLKLLHGLILANSSQTKDLN